MTVSYYIGIVDSMAKVMLKVAGWKCDRCDHEWQQRNKEQLPTVCPKCKSAYWNKPRQNKTNKPAKANN